MSRVVAVIQARCGSSRLPGKVLRPLGGVPAIHHVVRAVSSAKKVDEVVLATTTAAVDDALVAEGEALGVRVFRGDEEDVLRRFVEALRGDPADVVARQPADAPLVDPDIIDAVLEAYQKGGCDYAASFLERSWPRGCESEVISREALERSDREAYRPEDREHVTIHVRTHPEVFRLRNVRAPEAEVWPELRLTLDTPEDYAVLEKVFAALWRPGRILRISEVIAWMRAHPQVAEINAEVAQKPVLGRVL
ncbi:MAG TPA: glycosyltransferase family protein [Thermoanaerobaculia bacterium]